MSEPTLFDPGPALEQPVKLSAGARRTMRQHQAIAAGRHPANGLPIDTLRTCGTCTHLHRYGYRAKTYLKCPNHALGESHSEASDMRASWPACTLWRPEEGDQ